MLILIIGIAAAWYLTGVSGFLFWYTSEYDFTSEDVLLAVAVGLIGPISWVAGWLIHGGTEARVILRKRAKK